jgi:Glycosyl hydrolase family 26
VRRRLVTAALGFLLTGFVVLTGTSPVTHADVSTQFGVYVGSGNPARVREFGAWLGREPTVVLDYLDDSSWATLENPAWWAEAWSRSGYVVVYSVSLVPKTGGSIQAGAAGAYNEHFRRLAEALVGHRQGDAVLRLGWELNGDWTRWSAQSDPAAFAAYWRQVVTTMRGVPGAQFEFDWCVAAGHYPAVEAAYPGDAYVDYVGMDVYDTWWNEGERNDVERRWLRMRTQPVGLDWHRNFARAHGKRMTYPEWGLWNRPDGHGGGDNAYFLQRMHEWFADNDVAYQIYFEYDAPDGRHRLTSGQFPRGAAAYRSLFSTSSTATAEPSAGERRWRGEAAWTSMLARR